MAGRTLNGLVLILFMSLTSSYVIDDLYPGQTDTIEDMSSEFLKLDEMTSRDPYMNIDRNLDFKQVEDIVVPNVGPDIRAASEALNDSCWVEAKNKVPYRLMLEKQREHERALRKFYQVLQHGKKSIVNDVTWLKAKQSETCRACVLTKLCADPKIWNLLAIPSSWTR